MVCMAKSRKGPTRARQASSQGPVQSPQEALVAEVARYELARQGLERTLLLAVEVGRAQGCSWTDVGEAFNVTRQAAFQRFGRKMGGQA